MLPLEECYRLLEVEPTASADEIRGAYLTLVNVWHPDRFAHDPGLQDRAQRKLKSINGAFEAIKSAPLKEGARLPPPGRAILRPRPPDPAPPEADGRGPSGRSMDAEQWYALGRTLAGGRVELRGGESLASSNVGNMNQQVESIRAYQQAVTLAPEFADAWYALGVAHAQLNEHREAVQALRETVRLRPTHVGAWIDLGTTLVQQGRYPEVIDAFREALRLRPDDASVWYALGVAFGHPQIRRYEDARVSYLEAVRLRPELAEAWLELGLTLLKLRDVQAGAVEDAVAAFREAVALRPDLAEAWSTLGLTLIELERHEQAIEALRRALHLRPESTEAWFGLGTASRRVRTPDSGRDVEEAYFNLKRIDRREASRFLDTLPRHQRLWLSWRGGG
jgi:tetratricopeptide (TPR) repeat protein